MGTLAQLSWLQLKLFLREPLTVVFSLALPLIILFVLGGVFGNEPSQPGEEVFYRGVGAMDGRTALFQQPAKPAGCRPSSI